MQELKFGALCDAQKRANEGRKFLAWNFHVLPPHPLPPPPNCIGGKEKHLQKELFGQEWEA